MTHLVIDIGNTYTKIGVYSNYGNAQRISAIHSNDLAALKNATSDSNVVSVICSSVRTLSAVWLSYLTNLSDNFILLDDRTLLPIKLAYDTPETLGRDRIAAAVGAYTEYPKTNCFVVDAGTCITADFLRSDGIFVGGNISPGVNMRLKAMHEFTASLPLIRQGKLDNLMGKTTEEALRNGAQQGAVLEIRALLDRLDEIYSDIHVFITGGDMALFENLRKNFTFARPNLVLDGLFQISQYANSEKY